MALDNCCSVLPFNSFSLILLYNCVMPALCKINIARYSTSLLPESSLLFVLHSEHFPFVFLLLLLCFHLCLLKKLKIENRARESNRIKHLIKQ